VGLERVSGAARLAGSMPVVAIGRRDAGECSVSIGAGASAVAVISDLLVGDPLSA
jgi:thiamine monophosphate synthase